MSSSGNNRERSSLGIHGEHLLICAPSGRDGELTQSLLARSGFEASVCPDVKTVCERLDRNALGAVFLDERVLVARAVEQLRACLERQPTWSDIPLLVFSGERRRGDGVAMLGNVTFLDRPVRVRTIIAATQAAIRARRRQYQVRRTIELREQFVAMLGHELRNPLATMRVALDAMGRAPSGSEERYRAVLHRQTDHLARLVDDLLDTARLTNGKVALQRAGVDLVDVVKSCVEAARPAAEAAGLRITTTLPREETEVEGDRLRLEQVVSNLLTNALKYTPAGAVDVRLAKEGSTVTITVTDTGLGIAPDTLPHVFELFAQANRTLDRAEGGLGLGLTVVRELVELHGGSVGAKSEGLGKGASFEVRLPARGSTAVERPVANPERAGSAERARVVVVDDNEDLRELLGELLAMEGHDVVRTGHDGPSGLAAILDARPDVAFVDVGLPGFDGYEIARRVRTEGRTTRLVAVSGYGQPEDRARALAAGFDEHLKKPVALEALRGGLGAARRSS